MSRAINMPNLFGFRICNHLHPNLIHIFEIKEVGVILKIKLYLELCLNGRHFSAYFIKMQ